MIGIDLFAGAGGMSLGARQAGVKVDLAVELDCWAFETYRRNHPQTLTLQSDVRSLKSLHLPLCNEPIVLFGGPPCQGFSTSNQRTRNDSNTLNWMFKYFLSVVERVRPKCVVFENVAGIVHTANGTFITEIQNRLTKLKYASTGGLLNAADFGVPQSRTRYFLIGTRDDHPPPLPAPRADCKVTVADALHDLPALTNGAMIDRLPYRQAADSQYARQMRGSLAECGNHYVTRNAPAIIKRYRHIKAGGNWEQIPESLMTNYTDRTRCHTGIYRRLDPRTPAVVIGNFRKNMLIHPIEHRGLSVREAARLQSFPDWYEFQGSIGFQQQQVGNAVPPLLAEAVFRQIVAASSSWRVERSHVNV